MERTQFIDLVCMEAEEIIEEWYADAVKEAKGEKYPSMLPYWLGQVSAYQRCLDLMYKVGEKVVNSELPKDRKESLRTCVDE